MDKIIRCITDDGAIAVTAAETSDTVSYTHLDVYKRQVLVFCLLSEASL